MSDILDRICADKRAHVADCKAARPLALVEQAARAAGPARGFRAALEAARSEGRYGLIAEIKKASPSGGLIRPDFHPASLARAYAGGGASCLSVLTDMPYFQGHLDYLHQAREAATLPALRKDFMVDSYQVAEARAAGADCILLIMAALEDGQAQELEAAALEHGMDVLVEVHNADELERAVRLRSTMIGINNRNLKTLEVDLNTAVTLSAMLPEGYLVVGESGLKTPADLARLAQAQVTTFLIGESLMRQSDVAQATRDLLHQPGIAA